MRLRATLVLRSALAFGLASASAAVPASQYAVARTDLSTLRALLSTPDTQVDLAKAKLAIDRMIDPRTNTSGVLRQIDALAAGAAARFPAGASRRAKLDVLLSTLYQPGPWNQNRPFAYDLDDPFGRNRENKLLATYLRTRKGNCVSMPTLVAILGQRLGLAMTLATAPEHVLVKFIDDEGRHLNVEATAGGFKYDSSYERETGITPTAIQNEIYLRPLTARESVGVMASTLMEHYAAQKRGHDLLAVADMALAVNSKDVVAMIWKANAYYLQLQQQYVSRYPTPLDIPAAMRDDYARLSRDNLAWFRKAEALGWVAPSVEKEENYLQSIEREKARTEE